MSNLKTQREIDVFMEIWEERTHFSEISGVFLGHNPKPIFFFHILPKGSYPYFKYDKRNIILTTEQEHMDWHNSRDGLVDEPIWQWVFEEYLALESEYYQKFN